MFARARSQRIDIFIKITHTEQYNVNFCCLRLSPKHAIYKIGVYHSSNFPNGSGQKARKSNTETSAFHPVTYPSPN